ncbi:hypothetical protein IEBH_gp44 [Bacillus phage IEBH]|uniref:Uncharacterized protein n=1 Tax=Bacillus phage IEBH TaxID=2884422 RepID=B5LPQ5_9CAUD|nr:hypothetical protein IEBH_gp44 [Bacillus phage IEBH]ACH42301.1 hypothetical protein [Bacillus phage IEBH]
MVLVSIPFTYILNRIRNRVAYMGIKDIYQIASERVNDVADIPLCTVMKALEIDPNEIVSFMDEIEEG